MSDAILGFDTATPDVAVAVVAALDGASLAERLVEPDHDGRPRAATVLLPEVETAVAGSGGWERIGTIAVGVGPGSFTGLRIGVATARALAQARGLPLVAVGTLAALARGIREADADGRAQLAAVDARRGEAFAALHDAGGAEIWAPFVASPEALAARLAELGEAPLAAGDGALRFRREIEDAGAEVLDDRHPAHRLSARHLCALAAGTPAAPPEDVEPVYLRRPDAELWRERQRREHG
jgi:tRNA threonylcarbamoyladenosine biosynthesis protein TsaB